MLDLKGENFDPLGFTDIYINLKDVSKSDVHYPGSPQRYNVCDKLLPYFNVLHEQVCKMVSDGQMSFSLTYENKMLRCTVLNGVSGKIVSVRSQPMSLIDLRDISIPLPVKKVCTSPRLNKGGLILVSGSPGQGKTTTCAAILVDRLMRYGGFCLAIEDPVELPLDGLHGEGRCVQIEISNKAEYEDVGRLAMRCYPTDKQGMLFISEIRDSDSASLAMRAALDGRLVITTIHADGPISALKRLLSYATFQMGGTEARQLLSDGFRLCLHQEKEGATIDAKILMDTVAVSQLIRNGKLDMLGTELDRQQLLVNANRDIQMRTF